MPPYNKTDAEEEWKKIIGSSDKPVNKLKDGLSGRASRDFCALECLANDPLYAKPDSQKIFLLWEAKNIGTVKDEKETAIEGVKIETITGAQQKHPWVYCLFIGNGVVRFPFNTWDTDAGESLSWTSIHPDLRAEEWHERLLLLPRWSTASRSCLALIPESLGSLSTINVTDVSIYQRFELRDVKGYSDYPCPNVPEWKDYKEKRFCVVVKDPGLAASSAGTTLSGEKYRLYSVKTGVNYVGSKNEGKAKKHRLEANCSMAMLRSQVIESMPNNDVTFGVQTEVLTITAPMVRYNENDAERKSPILDGRDGFQVRDLSCMWPGLNYMPGQAIPYGRVAFDHMESAADQCDFWRKAFAVPLGRAKARLFLNYGLVHTSANAQNFLLGFRRDNCEQFVARDVGDTSWHDDYINKYFKESEIGVPVREAFKKESNSVVKHILHMTSSGDYPPPHIMRLAAYSVLTHGFADVLQDPEKSGWKQEHIYRFATGILDGFRDFIQEALELRQLYPENPDKLDVKSIKEYGVKGKYPTDKSKLEAYKTIVDTLLTERADALFANAAAVRRNGMNAGTSDGFDAFKEGAADGICTLINAEEILLCAGLEKRLGTAPNEPSKPAIRYLLNILLKGDWPSIVNS